MNYSISSRNKVIEQYLWMAYDAAKKIFTHRVVYDLEFDDLVSVATIGMIRGLRACPKKELIPIFLYRSAWFAVSSFVRDYGYRKSKSVRFTEDHDVCPPQKESEEKERYAYLTVAQAATYSGYDESTIRRFIYSGRLRTKKYGRVALISERGVIKAMREGRKISRIGGKRWSSEEIEIAQNAESGKAASAATGRSQIAVRVAKSRSRKNDKNIQQRGLSALPTTHEPPAKYGH